MSYSPQKKEDTYRLLKQAQNGDEYAREALVEKNIGLVKNIALKFSNSGHELDDLMQIGFIGLIKAIDKFDSQFDVMFSTYAVPMILGEIKRFLRDDGKIKVSRQIKQDVKVMGYLQETFYNKNGRAPKLSELAQLMGENTETILQLMEARDAIYNLESLDDPDKYEKQNSQLVLQDEDAKVDMIQLKSVIGNLGEKERQIIVLRYFQDLTQQATAKKLGISQVQVSRTEKKILVTLRKEMEG
ncbi:MAG: sigma-70 family RNA polymerase sigma factor [Anaerovorax sp.]